MVSILTGQGRSPHWQPCATIYQTIPSSHSPSALPFMYHLRDHWTEEARNTIEQNVKGLLHEQSRS